MIKTSFGELGVSDSLVGHLAERGINTPLSLQAGTIPDALSGHDVVAKTASGSGRILALGIPMIMKLAHHPGESPRGLVLVPTREMCLRISGELQQLGDHAALTVASVFGGASINTQRDEARAADIIVAIPGRLVDFVTRGDISVADVEMVVLVESDQLADKGYLPQVETILGLVDTVPQALVFSGMVDGATERFVSRHLNEPSRHEPDNLDSNTPVPSLQVHYSPTNGSHTDSPRGSLASRNGYRKVRELATSLRSHWQSFLALTLIVAAFVSVVLFAGQVDQPRYRSGASVVASEGLVIRSDFSSTAVAVFNTDTVAGVAARYAATGISPEALIPGIVSIADVLDSGVVEIEAEHADPTLAVLYADSVARALAQELSRVATGVGQFEVQTGPTVPVEPIGRSPWPTVILGLVVGLGSTLAVAALLPRIEAARTRLIPLRWRDVADRPGEQSGLTGSQTQSAGRPVSGFTVPPRPDPPPPDPYLEASTSQALVPIPPLVTHLDPLPQPSPVHPLLQQNEEAERTLQTIEGVDVVFSARLVAAGVMTIEELAAADHKWLADAIEVRREVTAGWIGQAVALVEARNHRGSVELLEDAGLTDVSSDGNPAGDPPAAPDPSESVRTGRSFGIPGPTPKPPRLPSSGERIGAFGPRRPADEDASAGLSGTPFPQRAEQGPQRSDRDLTVRVVRGIGVAFSDRLRDVGISDLRGLAEANAHTLSGELGIRYSVVAGWISQARSLVMPMQAKSPDRTGDM